MRRRVLVTAAIATVVAVTVFALPLAVAVRQLYLGQERSRLERAALEGVATVDPAYAAGDPIELPDQSDGIALAFYAADGHRVVGQGPSQVDSLSLSALRGSAVSGEMGGWLVTAIPAKSAHSVFGVVRAALPASQVWRRTIEAWGAAIGLGVLAMSVALLYARRQSARLTRPLENLARSAAGLGEGGQSTATMASGIAEIDDTASALDTSAGQIHRLLQRERTFSGEASTVLLEPVHAMRGRLRAGLAGDQDLRAVVTGVLAEADLLEAVIERLLNPGEPSTPPQGGQTAAVQSALLLIEKRWHGPLAAAGRPLRVAAEADTPAVTNEHNLTAALDILVEAAVRLGAGPLSVSARNSGGAVAVDVRSSAGVDVEPQRLARARSLAESAHGRLIVRTDDVSTVFTLFLPAADAQDSLAED